MLAWVGRFPGRDEPWLIRCPGPHHVTSEIRGGPWAPPPRICRHNSSVQIVLLCLVLVWLRSRVRFCSGKSGEKTLLFEFWPFKFRSLLGCFSGLGFRWLICIPANDLESRKVSNFVWMLQQSSRSLLQDQVETFHQPHILKHTLTLFGQKLPTVDIEKS